MSNYNGTLITIGTGNSAYSIPTSIIAADTYYPQVVMQDYEPWTDGNGYLHRNVVHLSADDGYKALKVEFETIPLTDAQLSVLMSNIYGAMSDDKARECTITAYIPELDLGGSSQPYISQKGYMADIKPQIYFADSNKIIYRPIRFAFIGGVADDS